MTQANEVLEVYAVDLELVRDRYVESGWMMCEWQEQRRREVAPGQG